MPNKLLCLICGVVTRWEQNLVRGLWENPAGLQLLWLLWEGPGAALLCPADCWEPAQEGEIRVAGTNDSMPVTWEQQGTTQELFGWRIRGWLPCTWEGAGAGGLQMAA